MEDKKLTVTMEQIDNYEFNVRFGGGAELLMDEPEPLGGNKGPSASKVLSAAIGNCLSASLLFCLQKARIDSRIIKTEVVSTMTRNDKGRLRFGGSKVTINADIDQNEQTTNRINKCVELFEDFCIVTQSIRGGVDVQVEVVNQKGERLYSSN